MIVYINMFLKWGQFVYDWRWLTLVLSFSIFILSPLAIIHGLKLDDGTSHINSPSEKANSLITDQLPKPKDSGSFFSLIFTNSSLSVSDPVFRQSLEQSLQNLSHDSRVKSIDTPYTTSDKSLVSSNGHEALVNVHLVDDNSTARKYYSDLRSEVKPSSLDVVATNGVAINHDFDALLESGLQRAEVVSLPLVLILLLLVFGAVVAGLIPLAIGTITIVTALAGVYLLSYHVNTSQYTINIVTLIGLGISIDYSLFIVSRFKEELSQLQSSDRVRLAIGRTMQTAGKTVTFSGLAVAIGLAGLLFYQGSFLSSMGLAGSIVVLSALFYSLTILPSILSLVGDRVNGLRMPIPRNSIQRDFWRFLSGKVMKYSWLTLIPVLAVLLLMAWPVFEMRIANSDVTALPPTAESRLGLDILESDFVGQTQVSIPVVVHFTQGSPLSPSHIDYLYDLNQKLASIPDVTSVKSPFSLGPNNDKQTYEKIYSSPGSLTQSAKDTLALSVGKDIVLFSVQTNAAGSSDEARNIVKAIQKVIPPTEGEILITGRTAFDIDFLNFIYQKSVYAAVFIILATLVIIFLMLRSVLLPLKAVLMNLLSISASFGVLVFIFQQGHFSKLLNFTPQSLDPSIPVLLFCIVFGLSMDYEVLLLSRIKEEYEKSHDNTQAVASGLEKSAVLITGAGLIMVCVFAAFGLADVVIIKAIGLGMAIAVFIDMTLVRGLVVPAIMRILGDANWWAPRFLRGRP